VRTSERHQLKHDRFAETTKDTISWAVEHRSVLVWSIVAAVIVVAAVVGSGWYWNYRNQDASAALGKAMETYNAPLRPPNAPASAETLSFVSAQERARAAHTEFQQIADRYRHTKTGKVAGYMAALTAIDMGDNKAGEEGLKQVAESGDKDLSSLAKMALAGVYRNTGRQKDALQLYKDMVEHPTGSVSKPMAQLELASLYEATNQGADASRLYDEIVKKNPRSTAAALAQQHLQGLK
jgi:predicted negative regulator of RcsB-dependent stress response